MNAWAAARPRTQNKNFGVSFALVAVVILPHVVSAPPLGAAWAEQQAGGEAGGTATGYNCLFISKHCCPYFRPCLCYPFWPHVTWGQASLVSLCVWMNFICNSAICACEIASEYVCVAVCVCPCVCVHMGANEFDVNCNFMRIFFAFSLSAPRCLRVPLSHYCRHARSFCFPFFLYSFLFSVAVSWSRVLLCV